MNRPSNKTIAYDPNHVPNEQFKQQLKARVLATYNQKESIVKKFNPAIVLGLGFSAVALIAVIWIGSFAFRSGDQPKSASNDQTPTSTPSDLLTQVTVNADYSTGGGDGATTSIAGGGNQNDNYDSTSQAADAVGFTPLTPSKANGSEVLTELYSTEGLTGGAGRSLYLSYGTKTQLLYQLIQIKQSTPQQPLPPEVTTITFNRKSTEVIASINEFWNDQTPADQIYPGTPRRTISFVIDGVGIDLSEYGQISLDQLRAIASSLN